MREIKFKKPETFEDILNLQKHLDESIHSSRERTLEDIKLSLIAECIEFNEETKDNIKEYLNKNQKYTHLPKVELISILSQI